MTSEVALDLAPFVAVSALEFHESDLDLDLDVPADVSAIELNDPALERSVLPPIEAAVGDDGT